MTPRIDWDDPVSRARLIEEVGAEKYNELFRQHVAESTIATEAGHVIRAVRTRFGRLFLVGSSGHAFATLDDAKDFARRNPAKH